MPDETQEGENMGTAFITGSGRGIGAAIARRLADDGFAVAVSDIDTAAADEVAAEINAEGGRAAVFGCDVSDRESIIAAVAAASAELGPLEVMVNNAGIIHIGPLDEIRPDDLDRMSRINIGGIMWGMQAAIEQFRANGTRGRIINACSGAAYRAGAYYSLYAVSKTATRALTQIAAQELGAEGITVNAYAPGVIDTPMWDVIDEKLRERNGLAPGENKKRFASGAALADDLKPDHVADLVSFLAGPGSAHMTGQTVVVDGGKNFA
jgi:meso-butanediol dehydrogenase/(S,S)-butanediol dehydrogenase/diacetyl reductase